MRLARLAPLFLLALPLAAQDGGDDAAAKERTQALLAKLTDVDERLLGTTKFTVYVQNTVKLGEMVLTVERSAEAEKGAYATKLDATIQAGPARFESQEELLLGVELGARSGKRRKADQQGEQKNEEKQTLAQVDGKWELTRVRNADPEQKGAVALVGPNFCSLASLLLLTRQLDLTKAEAYLLQATRWKEGQEAPTVYPTRLVVQPAAKKIKRGDVDVELAAVKLLREGESPMTVFLDAERQLVEMTDDDKGVRFAVGEAPPPPPPGAGAESPMKAVMTYLYVLAKAEPVEALNGALDWEEIYAGMCAEDENIKEQLTADQLAEILRQQFAQAEAGITKEQVEMLQPLLEVKEEGATAEVAMPGAPAPFKLKKGETGWKITYFPH